MNFRELIGQELRNYTILIYNKKDVTTAQSPNFGLFNETEALGALEKFKKEGVKAKALKVSNIGINDRIDGIYSLEEMLEIKV